MLDATIKGRYQITKILSSGNYCKTYMAKDLAQPQPTACVIKHLLPGNHHGSSLSSLRRLLTREATALEKLSAYSQVPQLLDYFEDQEQFYLVLEYIHGQPLSSLLALQVRWSESQVIQLLVEVLTILEVVHAHGLIHRDITPNNLIRRDLDGKLVLIDFGSVKQAWTQVVTSQGQTNTNYAIGIPATVAIGTPGYMPSEQSRGRPRPNSDIYALGMIAIQAITGQQPNQLLEDADTGEVIWQHLASVNPQLVAILNQMVRYHFTERYQSAKEVLAAIQALEASARQQLVGARELPVQGQVRVMPATSLQDKTKKVAIRIGQRQLALWLGMAVGITSTVGLIIGSYYATRPSAKAVLSVTDPQATSAKSSLGLVNVTLARTLEGHAGVVWAIAISQDGRTLVSGSGDKTIRFWDLDTGQLRHTISEHAGDVLSVALSPNGQTLTSSSYAKEQAIKSWNLGQRELRPTYYGNSSRVWAVALSPDGQTLISSSGDENIKIWHLRTGRLLRTLSGHSDIVWTISVSPDGQTLASGSRDKTIKIWNLRTGSLQRTLSGHSNRVRSVAISSDGKTLVSSSWDKTIKIWNLRTGQLIRTLTGHSGYVNSVAISFDNRIIASGSDDRTIKLWDLQTGELVQTLFGHSGNVNCVSFNKNGKILVSASEDKTIKVWQLQASNI